MKTIMKANGKSKSGKTFYFDIKVPAGVISVKDGTFNGTCSKEEATIDEISWCYSWGRKYINITLNGKNRLEDYIGIMKKYMNN